MPFGSLMFEEIRQELPPDIHGALSEEGMELGLKAWKLVKAGCDKYTIHRKLQVPLPLIEATLKEFQLCVGIEAGRAMEHFRLLDCERVDDLIAEWLPVARPSGEPLSEEAVDYAVKAAYVVLHAIDRQLQILGIGQPKAGKAGTNQTDIWVRVQQAIQQIEGGPISTRKTLFLESDAEELE